MRLIIILILFIVAPFVGRSEAEREGKPKIEVSLSPTTIMIGDQPILQIKITKDVSQKVAFPEFDRQMNDYIEVLMQGAIDTVRQDNSREMTLTRNYLLTTFVAGEHHIDSLPVFYLDGNVVDTLYSTQPMKLMVNTYLIDTTTQTIFDIKPPIHTRLLLKEILNYIMLGIVALIVIAIIIYVVIKLRRKEPIFSKPKVPAHIKAESQLSKIKDMQLWQQGKHKEYYTMITDTIRNYLDDRFHKNAMEMTTDEIMTSIKDDAIPQGDKDMLQELLMLSDLVKFAKFTPSIDDNERSFATAYDFVEHTKRAEESIDNEEESNVEEVSSNEKREEEKI